MAQIRAFKFISVQAGNKRNTLDWFPAMGRERLFDNVQRRAQWTASGEQGLGFQVRLRLNRFRSSIRRVFFLFFRFDIHGVDFSLEGIAIDSKILGGGDLVAPVFLEQLLE